MKIRLAQIVDLDIIWEIISQAIEKRRLEGSTQWQDGYPNPNSIMTDIKNNWGRVLLADDGKTIIGYAALIFDIEEAYEDLEGEWLTNGRYAVIHRMAVLRQNDVKGIGSQFLALLEDEVKKHDCPSLKVDTNFDNNAMLRVFEKRGFTYCGEVYFRGSARRAYEKVLSNI